MERLGKRHAMVLALQVKEQRVDEVILNDYLEVLDERDARPYVSTSFNSVIIPLKDANVHLIRSVILGAHESLLEYNDVMEDDYRLMLKVEGGKVYVLWAVKA